MGDSKGDKKGESAFANASFNFSGGGAFNMSNLAQAVDQAGGVAELPAEALVRVEYLDKLQEDRLNLREEYLEERKALERKYAGLYQTLYDKRGDVLAGKVDVAKAEDGTFSETPGAGANTQGEDAKGTVGVPEFWLRAMMNHGMLQETIAEEDVPALEYLTDIRCIDKEDYTGFRLEFHFAQPNPYFSNATLSKAYEVADLLDTDESELQAAAGTDIQWKPGKNLCVQEKRMKPRGKSRGGVVVKTVPKESFFNFFAALEVPEDPEELDEEEYEELMSRLEYDFSLALAFRNEIVPEAIKWFRDEGESDSEYEPSEGSDEDDDEDDDESGSEEEDEEDESSSDEGSEGGPRRGGGRGRGRGGRGGRGGPRGRPTAGGGAAGAVGPNGDQQECKQS